MKIDIEECLSMAGFYFVTVDEDPEHYLSTLAASYDEAVEIAEDIEREWNLDNGQFGVGA